MKLTMLKAKIHRATVTMSNLEYEGSISIDSKLCEAAGLRPFEKVDIYDCMNGERFSTYVIFGTRGEICLNGAAARKVHKGDIIIIASYAEFEETEAAKHKPKLVYVDAKNDLTRVSDVIEKPQ